MTISVLQEIAAYAGAGGAASVSATFAFAVTAGSSIHVFWGCSANPTSVTCSDTVNGSYGSVLDFGQAGTQQRFGGDFVFNNASAGTPTVTVTPSIQRGDLSILIREIGGTSGLDTAASSGGHIFNGQNSPGTGADAVTSTTITPSVQPGLISAIGLDGNRGPAPSSGTGFTFGINAWNMGSGNTVTSESLRYTALAAKAATFTAVTGTDSFLSVAAFFKEAGSGLTPAGATWLSNLSPSLVSPSGPLQFWSNPGSGIGLQPGGFPFPVSNGPNTGGGLSSGRRHPRSVRSQ